MKLVRNIAEYYSVAEVADILNMSKQTIKKMIRLGELDAYSIGNRYRVKRTDFDSWIESRKVQHG